MDCLLCKSQISLMVLCTRLYLAHNSTVPGINICRSTNYTSFLLRIYNVQTEYLLCIINKIVNLGLQLKSRRQNLYYLFVKYLFVKYFLLPIGAPCTVHGIHIPHLPQQKPSLTPTACSELPSSTEDCFTFLFFPTLLLKVELIFPSSKFPESLL